MVPRGTWLHLLIPFIGASLATGAGVRAQESQTLSVAVATAESPRSAAAGQPVEIEAAPSTDAAPAESAASDAAVTAEVSPAAESADAPPLESAAPAEAATTVSPASAEVSLAAPTEAAAEPQVVELTAPAAPAPEAAASTGIGNDEIREMAAAQFGDSTIIAVIGANETRFDVSPRALVALKNGGVSERVIEAMIAAEAAKKTASAEVEAEEPEPDPAAAAAAAAAQAEYAKLTEMVERLAAQQQAAAAAQEAARRATEPAPRSDPTPRAWILGPADRTAVSPTIAQVGFAGGGKRGERFRTLQGLAGQALAFANPAVSGIATTLGSLFRSDEERTAVWALASPSSSRMLPANAGFEIDFAQIPGVDPDRYNPAIVQLVPTTDNYRLVAAAETEGSNAGALPSGEIIEELVATDLTRLARGRYRVAPRSALHPGEYALVLRPVQQSGRQRRRNKEASLGELLGGATTQILYLTWDFSVEPPAAH